MTTSSAPATGRAWAHRLVLRHDPLIGQRYVPDQRARVPFEDGGYLVETNSAGFRSDVEFVAQKGDRPRILFLGDSYTAGYGVDNRERFPEIAGEHLGVEVYNAGITGTGTDQQVLAYENYLADLECDLIVLSVWIENIERVKARFHRSIDPHSHTEVYTAKPYFELGVDGELELHNVPVPHGRREAAGEDLYGRGASAGPIDRIRAAAPALLGDDVAERIRQGRGRALYHRFQRLTNRHPYPDYGDDSSRGWQLMEAIIDRLVTAADGTPVLVIPIPTVHYFRGVPLRPVFQERFESLADPARRVHVANLTERIADLPHDERAQLTFSTDAHYSRRGNRAVGRCVADAIAQLDGFNLVGGGETVADGPGRRDTEAERAARSEYVLGLSCFYHNSAASLLRDGKLVAAAEEERFTRLKADRGLPVNSVNYCLEEAGISPRDLSAVVYYDNAYLTFERLMHTQLAVGEGGSATWERVVPSWVNQKLRIPEVIRSALNYDGEVFQASHHRSHAASAYFMSPFESAAVLTIDGVGEWSTATIGRGRGADLELLREMRFPDSVGLLYSAFTQFVGFKVNNGEYKMMGLAPYGSPIYVQQILDNIVDIKHDGSIELDLDFFAFLEGKTMTSPRFEELFGGPARGWEDPVTQREMDISASIQEVTTEIVMRMARHAQELTGERRLCLAGGVALNCVANGKLLREGPFDELWIQPAAGDAGGSLGAALDFWHTHLGRPRPGRTDRESPQAGSLWGPAYSDNEIQAFLDSHGFPYERILSEDRAERVAAFIEDGKVVGHFSGRTEFGPRALGARSILGDARNPDTQSTLNLRIKYRESFRPFAPTVLAEDAKQFFELEGESPYMLIVAPVREERRLPFRREPEMDAYDIVRQPRSDVPAITHIDYSARIQTVTRLSHREYYDVIASFRDATGTGLVVNTSFNVRGEPIVCTPYDAYRCFMRTEMDVLVMGNQLLVKDEQPPWHEEKGHLEGDGVGDDDFERTPLVSAVRRVFDESFAPVMRRLENEGRATRRIRTASRESTWSNTGSLDNIFEIPSSLHGSAASPVDRARDICSYWEPGAVRDALLPVVERLVEVGDEYAEELWSDAPISESIYVLY